MQFPSLHLVIFQGLTSGSHFAGDFLSSCGGDSFQYRVPEMKNILHEFHYVIRTRFLHTDVHIHKPSALP